MSPSPDFRPILSGIPSPWHEQRGTPPGGAPLRWCIAASSRGLGARSRRQKPGKQEQKRQRVSRSAVASSSGTAGHRCRRRGRRGGGGGGGSRGGRRSRRGRRTRRGDRRRGNARDDEGQGARVPISSGTARGGDPHLVGPRRSEGMDHRGGGVPGPLHLIRRAVAEVPGEGSQRTVGHRGLGGEGHGLAHGARGGRSGKGGHTDLGVGASPKGGGDLQIAPQGEHEKHRKRTKPQRHVIHLLWWVR